MALLRPRYWCLAGLIFGSLFLGTSVGDSSCTLTLHTIFDKEAVKKAVSRYDSWAYSTQRRDARNLSTIQAITRSLSERNSPAFPHSRPQLILSRWNSPHPGLRSQKKCWRGGSRFIPGRTPVLKTLSVLPSVGRKITTRA